MTNSKMKTCMLCHSTTTGHRNDLFDEGLKNIKLLSQYITEQRFNQAGNVLIKHAQELLQTFDGCCTEDETIQKYGKEVIKLIELGMEISSMDSQGKFK